MTIAKINTNVVDEYLSYDKLYENRYEKYIVLLQVGSFMEIYGIEKEPVKLKEISNILNIVLTKKNKNIEKISKSNSWLLGFPCVSLDKYIKILINNEYTIPVYRQIEGKNGKKNRVLEKIYSITTYIDDDVQLNDYNNITSIYIEQIKDNYLMGLSTIDIITSKNNIYEIYVNDINKLLEELNRYLIIHNPREIIYDSISLDEKDENIIIHLLNNITKILHINKNYNKEFSKITYQNEFLGKIFKNTNLLSPIEYINMERNTIGLISYISLLNFIYNYDNTSITNISKPIINYNSESLICHNNALYQLNIISNDNRTDSLFKYINYTSTLMGKRKLKNNLTNPITNIDELNKRYDMIDIIKYNKKIQYFISYEKKLKNIIDIERYHNKLKNCDITPNLYCKLNVSYINIIDLIKLSKKDYKDYYNYELLDKFNEYYDEYLKYFNLNNMQFYINNLYKTSIFNDNIFEDVDNIITKIKDTKLWMTTLCQELSDIIDNKLSLEFNDKTGYFLVITKARCKTLQEKIKENEKYKDLLFDNRLKSMVKITSPEFINKSYEILKLYNKLNVIINQKYTYVCNLLYTKYSKCFIYLNEFISNIDVIISNTKLALMHNYTRPKIDDKYDGKSYISCTDIKHPIIERILDNESYISNDVNFINDKQTGILLYGVNGCGKSAYSKSIGINIILAQSGIYTSAENFEFYPYNKIFTRINKNDDLFRGRSSFEIEMLELKTILNMADRNSLVLGDEICSTSENISGLSIISTTINNFLRNDISFIFASHIHNINNYIDKELIDKVYIGHLTVEIKKNKLIYTRQLKDGIGERNYGLMVANFIFNDIKFEKESLIIQNKILDNHNQEDSKHLLNTKKSSFNKKVYVDYCYICKDMDDIENRNNLDTHHIKFQCTFEKGENKVKNIKSNLVILCKLHHQQVHKELIKINKWNKTSNGYELDYMII